MENKVSYIQVLKPLPERCPSCGSKHIYFCVNVTGRVYYCDCGWSILAYQPALIETRMRLLATAFKPIVKRLRTHPYPSQEGNLNYMGSLV